MMYSLGHDMFVIESSTRPGGGQAGATAIGTSVRMRSSKIPQAIRRVNGCSHPAALLRFSDHGVERVGTGWRHRCRRSRRPFEKIVRGPPEVQRIARRRTRYRVRTCVRSFRTPRIRELRRACAHGSGSGIVPAGHPGTACNDLEVLRHARAGVTPVL